MSKQLESILTKSEQEQLLIKFNDTTIDYPRDKTLVELFDDVVEKYPNQLAVSFLGQQLTYRELQQKSEYIAMLLLEHGVKPDDLVAILVDNSLEMIIGIMGVLKSGGAFLPIAHDTPIERVNYILEDSATKVLLTKTNRLPAIIFNALTIDLSQMPYIHINEYKQPKITNNNLAYAIYTSGTTGRPKGTLIEHGSVINFIFYAIKRFDLDQNSIGSKYAGFGFDASIIEIFPILFSGGKLCLIPNSDKLDVELVNKFFMANRVSFAFLPTQFAEIFMGLGSHPTLKVLIVAGEKLRNFHSTNYKIVNAYGPTEATVHVTDFIVDRLYANIPIGKPIANVKCYVLDEKLSIVAVGLEGELYIGGECLARGYLNQDELTRERFIPNPFQTQEEKHNGLNQRIYKTGDLVRWLSDGTLEYIGRNDFQVKVRGFRVELGEIEHHLSQLAGVRQTLVSALTDANGGKYLCAYYTATKALDIDQIRNELIKHLVSYMVPDHFIYLAQFPLNVNGKIDRKALPVPDTGKLLADSYVAPNTQEEILICNEFANVLNVERVGIKDNFFTLGGNSISAIRLVSHLQNKFEISVADVFNLKIPLALAKLNKNTENKNILKVATRDFYPASYAQERMFVANQIGDIGVAYNLPNIIKMSGELDREKVGLSIDRMILRHESLRTNFMLIDDKIVQVVHDTVEYKKEYQKASSPELGGIIKEFVQPFDLTKLPLFRMKLVKVSRVEHYLLFDVHHSVFDGGSLEPFLKDLTKLYAGDELPRVELSYKDYAVWQREGAGVSQSIQQKEYWLSKFKDVEIEPLRLPLDHPRSNVIDYIGSKVDLSLCGEDLIKLKSYAMLHDASLYTLCVTSLVILLYRYTCQGDIVIGCATSGRSQIAAQDLVGMFVNTVPFISGVDGNVSIENLIATTHANVLGMLSHQDYPMEDLIAELGLLSSSVRNPLFDVMFNFLEVEGSAVVGDLEFSYAELGGFDMAKFDLTFNCILKESSLELSVSYRTSLFNEETISRLLRHYANILTVLANVPKTNLTVKDIDILDEVELDRLLFKFNHVATEYPRDKTLIDLFYEVSAKYPNNIAVLFENSQLSYQELNEKSNQLAHYLTANYDIEADDLIALYLDRSEYMVIAILGVLKAGAGYVPIDPEYPNERILYILQDTCSQVVLSNEVYNNKLTAIMENWLHSANLIPKVEYIDTIDLLSTLSQVSRMNLSRQICSTNLAYVIYTSGTTGNPKGVMVEHKGLVAFCMNNNYIDMNVDNCVLGYSNYVFDGSIFDIFVTLLNGARFIMVTKDTILNIDKLIQVVTERSVNTLFTTTALFCNYADFVINPFAKVRTILFGGEKVNLNTLGGFVNKNPQINLIHVYGPTENIVFSTYCPINQGNVYIAPIGKPLSDKCCYVLDKDLNLMPEGAVGELYIGGDGIARGYLHQIELTRKSFILNPFQTLENKNSNTNGVLYKTGDLVRYLPNGDIEYIGRNDFQVKVRGFRIELGEIEERLNQINGVAKSLILALNDKSGTKYLCAYYSGKVCIAENVLRDLLSKCLASYMVPDHFIYLESFPLNINGKIDRKALPIPDMDKLLADSYVAPNTKEEVLICDEFAHVLNVERVGIKDDFFKLGGNSIKAIRLVSRLQDNFKINVSDIFNLKDPGSLAKALPFIADNLRLKLAEIRKLYANLQRDVITTSTSLEKQQYRDVVADLKIDVTSIKAIKRILLTGATGFLGIHILYQLLANTDYQISVIVRARSDVDAEARLLSKYKFYFDEDITQLFNKRVYVLAGDIEKNDLSINKDVYNDLLLNVDSIIHAAALVKHYGEYAEFYLANVQATINLLDVAEQSHGKDFHYISTYSVCEVGINGIENVLTSEDFMPQHSESIDNVYVRTKFEGELITIAGRKRGITTNIYRVGNQSFNTLNNRNQENIEDNGFYNRIKAMLNLGYLPDVIDEVEMSPVDETALAIVKIFNKTQLSNQTYHVYNPNQVKVSDLLSDTKLGLNVERVSVTQFIDAVESGLKQSTFRHYVELFMLHQGWLADGDSARVNTFELVQDRTNHILSQLGFAWSVITPIMFNELINKAFTERVGYLRNHRLWNDIADKDIISISRLFRLQHEMVNHMIIKEGAFSDKVYFLKDGFIEVYKNTIGGWLGTVGILGAGDVINVGGLVSECNIFTAETILSDAELYAIDAPVLSNMLENKSFSGNLVTLLLEEKGNLLKMVVAFN